MGIKKLLSQRKHYKEMGTLTNKNFLMYRQYLINEINNGNESQYNVYSFII